MAALSKTPWENNDQDPLSKWSQLLLSNGYIQSSGGFYIAATSEVQKAEHQSKCRL